MQESIPFLQSCIKYCSSILSSYYFSKVPISNEAIIQNERSIEGNHVTSVCLGQRKTRSPLSFIQIRHLYVLNQSWVILQCFQAIIYNPFCTMEYMILTTSFRHGLNDIRNIRARLMFLKAVYALKQQINSALSGHLTFESKE